jgi:hypothetical protein
MKNWTEEERMAKARELISKLDSGERVFGYETPHDIKNGIVRFHSWENEGYLCRKVVEEYGVPSGPRGVIEWTSGYAGNTTNINLKYFRAFAKGKLDKLLKKEEERKEEKRRAEKKKEEEKRSEELLGKVPEELKSFVESFVKEGFSGYEGFFGQDDLVIVTSTEFDTSTHGVGQYCTPSTVTDYHVRICKVYQVVESNLNEIARGSERKLFRTTERGVVDKHYEVNVVSVKRRKGSIWIEFKDGGMSVDIK